MHVPWECEWHVQVRARGCKCGKEGRGMDRSILPFVKMEELGPSERSTKQREDGKFVQKQSSMDVRKDQGS